MAPLAEHEACKEMFEMRISVWQQAQKRENVRVHFISIIFLGEQFFRVFSFEVKERSMGASSGRRASLMGVGESFFRKSAKISKFYTFFRQR